MPKEPKRDRQAPPPEGDAAPGMKPGRKRGGGSDESREYRVEDKRHWADGEIEEAEEAPSEPKRPTLLDEYRLRAEAAEQQLQEYIEAFKKFKAEHEEFRERLNRDVERRVELKFGELVGELLGCVDNLDLGLEHAVRVPEAKPLAEGVLMAREHFLGVLEQHGVTQVAPDGQEFDPNEAEAVRIDPVEREADHGKVTETVRPGYRLGDRVIRAARVAVGRYGGR